MLLILRATTLLNFAWTRWLSCTDDITGSNGKVNNLLHDGDQMNVARNHSSQLTDRQHLNLAVHLAEQLAQ
jgi:hypothetical protein